MLKKSIQPRDDGKKKVLEVRERSVSGSSDIGWGEQAEDIFNRLRERPELVHRSAIGLAQVWGLLLTPVQ